MPTRPPSPCAYPPCPELTPTTRCPEHTRQHDRTYTRHRNVYNTTTWKRLRTTLLREHPWCATPDCNNMATEVDHIVPLSEGGEPYDQNNLQPLCRRHHSQKTAREVWGRKG